MSGFAALMALSASQTKESESAVQSALLQRQRKEELRRKQQEERERKERDLETKLRLQHFENEKREQEREQRKAEERRAKEKELRRREEEQRDSLRYGPKKAKLASEATPKWPTSSSQSHTRREVRRRALPDDDDDEESVGGSPRQKPLTREEKRERKLQADMNRSFHTVKRSTHTGGYFKASRRLPGGAIDVATGSQSPGSGAVTKSVKERITAMPNTLTKLNTVKRDTRTIDEILQDRAKARDLKVLDGDEAREFNDWFGTSKKKESAKMTCTERGVVSAPTSDGTHTPVSVVSSAKKISARKPSPLAIQKSRSKSTGPSSSGLKSVDSTSRSASYDKYPTSKTIIPTTKTLKSASTATSHSAINMRSPGPSSIKKRPRSSTRSESPPPPKRRAVSPDSSASNWRTEIWQVFGRKRDDYVGKDVLSDDDDMEADAMILEKEEKLSARIARKEEEEATEAERRHEEEKRRRRKEKEIRERRW